MSEVIQVIEFAGEVPLSGIPFHLTPTAPETYVDMHPLLLAEMLGSASTNGYIDIHKYRMSVESAPVDPVRQKFEDLYDLCQKFIDQEGIEEQIGQMGIAMQLGVSEEDTVVKFVTDIAKIVGYAHDR